MKNFEYLSNKRTNFHFMLRMFHSLKNNFYLAENSVFLFYENSKFNNITTITIKI